MEPRADRRTLLAARVEQAARAAPVGHVREVAAPIVRGWLAYFGSIPQGAKSLGAHDGLIRELADAGPAAAARGPRAPAAEDPSTETPAEIELEDEDPWHTAVSPRLDVAEDADELTDALVREGRYAEAEAVSAVRDARPPAPEVVEGVEEPVVLEVWAEAFIAAFCARQELFEAADLGRARQEGAPRPFEVVARAPSFADVRAHLAGEKAIAVRPRLADGTATIGAIDIDPAPGWEHRGLALAVAIGVLVARSGGSLLLEETGGRGLHLWMPLESPVRADTLAQALAAVVEAAGAPAERGLRVELLPGRDDAPDLYVQAVTLPLGRHVETGAPSRLQRCSGEWISWVGASEVEAFGPRTSAEVVDALQRIAAPELAAPAVPIRERAPTGWGGHGEAVERVMKGCAVLRHLALKAEAAGHLSHAERLSVLHTLGHLGPRGEDAIRAIISRCANYDAEETSRQIARLGKVPLGCARIRSKHASELQEGECPCSLEKAHDGRGFPTPVLHALRFKRAWTSELKRRKQERARRGELGGVRATPLVAVEPPLSVASIFEGAPCKFFEGQNGSEGERLGRRGGPG